jgi:hypothetical protein
MVSQAYELGIVSGGFSFEQSFHIQKVIQKFLTYSKIHFTKELNDLWEVLYLFTL